ncbi:MAG: hypothetical protein AB7J28_13620 [Hyphomonadaceae bacterium]
MRKLVLGLMAAALVASVAYAQEEKASPPPADDGVVVRGQIERPVPAPPGDPRTSAQRMEDIRAWDRCVNHAQNIGDQDPTRYQAESPEELCRRTLGMADREALPATRNVP